MITGSQCHAGHALVEVSRAKLADRASVDISTIEQFERKLELPTPLEIEAIQSALEELGRYSCVRTVAASVFG